MLAPTDRNERIALARRWTWQEQADAAFYVGGHKHGFTHWRNPDGKPLDVPDYVGTLEGVSEMLRGLNDWERSIGSIKRWYITHVPNGFTCQRRIGVEVWESYTSKEPGDCVGDAWLSMFGKEAADA